LRWFRVPVLDSISPGAVVSEIVLRIEIKRATVLDPGLAPRESDSGAESRTVIRQMHDATQHPVSTINAPQQMHARWHSTLSRMLDAPRQAH
jgi:hypothetical protein